MAVLIPDNIRSRADVPAGLKRVAGALETGLDESATAWYEPPYAPNGHAPHFVVLLPDRGIVVLEVLDVRASGVLGILRGRVRIQRDDQELEVESPLARADSRANELRGLLSQEKSLAGFQIPVAAGAVFPSLDRDEALAKKLDRQIDLSKCIFKTEITQAIQDSGSSVLLRSFNRLLGTESLEEPLPDAIEKLLRAIIRPEIVIDRAIAQPGRKHEGQSTIFRPNQGADLIRVMDRAQEVLARNLEGGHRVIRGVAGSGKTLILVYRARVLAQAHPRKRVLVCCYTRTLMGELRAQLAAQKNIDVYNMDSLMADVIRDSGQAFPGYADDRTGEKVASLALDSLPSFDQRYVAVLLDEAQDFSTTAMQFALGMLLAGSDDVLVVADAAQNIFRKKFSWSQAGIQARGRTRILRTNYRNTQEILEYAYKFLLTSAALHADDMPDMEDENAIIPPEASSRRGEQPVTILVNDSREEVAAVVGRVRSLMRLQVGRKSIAVLYGSPSSVADGIMQELNQGGINVLHVNTNEAKGMLSHTQAQVILSSIASAKGLEFPHVVLSSPWRTADDLDTNRKLAYVGMTRATETLTVIAQKTHPLAKQLET